MSKSFKDLLHRITGYLLINYPYIPNYDLMTGRMGGVLYFKHCARRLSEKFYDDFADSLLDSVFSNFKDDMPVNFYKGYCGIGWAVEYLVKNGMAEGNTDKVLENIDKKIMERDPGYISDMSFETGLAGIVYYVICRLKSFDRMDGSTPFDRSYIKNISDIINSPEIDFPANLTEEFNSCIKGKVDYSQKLSFPSFLLDGLPVNLEPFNDNPLGIYRGLTGVALKMIGV